VFFTALSSSFGIISDFFNGFRVSLKNFYFFIGFSYGFGDNPCTSWFFLDFGEFSALWTQEDYV